jgi:hypothetical protein
MPPATLIARLVGPLFVVIGVGILLNEPFYLEVITEAVRFPTLIYLYGVLALLAGIAILGSYRAWTRDWRIVITALGWLCAIGGVVRIVLPQLALRVAPPAFVNLIALTIVAVLVLLVGGLLSFKGYRA